MENRLISNRFPAPVDEVRDRRLSSRGAHQHGNLTSVIPGMAEKLGENVFETIAKSPGVQTLILERSSDCFVREVPEKVSP